MENKMSEEGGFTRSIYVRGQHAGYVAATEEMDDGQVQVTIRMNSGRRSTIVVSAAEAASTEPIYMSKAPGE
jgi:hypothetical protein